MSGCPVVVLPASAFVSLLDIVKSCGSEYWTGSFFVFSLKCSLFLLSIALDLAQLKSEADDSKKALQKVLYSTQKSQKHPYMLIAFVLFKTL